MPILTASTPMSLDHRVDLGEDDLGGTGWTALTPCVFCAVIAVTAVIAWPPSMVTVLMSAWIPRRRPNPSRR
jgi:hypothetical protein